MDRAPSTVESLHALELRVLEGPQRGARAALVPGLPCVLAAGPDGAFEGADIVLREELLPPARVRLCAELIEATLEVLEGEVRLGTELLAAGRKTSWPQHAPLQIGRSSVAFGRACIDDWKAPAAAAGAEVTDPEGDASGPAPASAAAIGSGPQGDDPTAAPGRELALARAATPWRQRAELWLAGTGIAVLIACGGALAIARVSAQESAPAFDEAMQIGAALRGSEFAGLEVRRAADGRLALKGRLATQAERSRLDVFLAALPPGLAPMVDVRVDEQVAREVTEVLRVNGVTARAKATGPGQVTAEVDEPDTAKLARAQEAARRDVPGLERLALRNAAPPPVPPAPVVPDDPGKRIASLVPGNPGFLVTADGARYFTGAMLPTGHRITCIDPGRVTLERNGQSSTLMF